MNRPQLAQQAMREAGRFRTTHGASLADSICPYDLAIASGLTVQFLAVPSLEGMYEAERGAIFIGSERPSGRRRFTCAHELGHHVFKHGTSLDQLRTAHTDNSKPEEFVADCFAASLLMPKMAIDAALHRRGWSHRPLTAPMVFELAQDLGVAFDALVTHLNLVLHYISGALRTQLEKKRLPDIRDEIAGFSIGYDAFPLDEHWGARPVDVEVGDVLMTGARLVEGECVEPVATPRQHMIAVQAGTARVRLPSGRLITVRVMRRDYSGRAQFRHEEVEEEEG